MSKFIRRKQFKGDLSNYKFGKLEVIRYFDSLPDNKGKRWYCICGCGNVALVTTANLRSGRVKSCGCYTIEVNRARKKWPNYKDINGHFFRGIVRGAIKRDIEFDLTVEEIWDQYIKQDKKCALSGVDIIFDLDAKKKTASVDRIDCVKGYTKDNIQIVHKFINLMRKDHKVKKFFELCKTVVEYLGPRLENE